MLSLRTLSNFLLIAFLTFASHTSCSNALKKSVLENKNTTLNMTIHVKVVPPKPKPKTKKKINHYSHLFIVLTEKCTSLTCSSPQGKCLNENVCKCTKGFANAPQFSSQKNQFCQYKQKKHYTALFLEIVFFCGMGHLYSHRVIMFFIKFLFFAATVLLRLNLNSYSEEKASIMKRISQIAFFSAAGFYFFIHSIDLMMFYLNKYPDGYGIPLTKH